MLSSYLSLALWTISIIIPSFTVSSMDYEVVFTLLMFNMCEVRKCTDINIINDATLENVELFSVSLLTSNLDYAISLDPHAAEIEIIDNDGLCDTFCCKM